MGSEKPEQATTGQPAAPQQNEDELLGVIADVERQLQSLKSHRSEREQFRQRLESREQELTERDQQLTERANQLREQALAIKSAGEQQNQRLESIAAAEAEVAKKREKLERDFAALAEEQRRAADAAAKEAADIKAMSVALEQREQRLAEHAANISRQREQFELTAAELAKKEERLSAAANELEQARASAMDLKARLDESERISTSRVAELDQVTQRAMDLERRVSELTKSAEEARRQLDEQGARLGDQLKSAKEELKRAGEAQSALMAELAARDKSIAASRAEFESFKGEVAKKLAAATENEARLADFKRQVIERDGRIQDLSTKLASATSKFREVSETLQEQAALAEKSQVLQAEIRDRDRKIAELQASTDSTAARADLEALEQQLQQMRSQLQEAKNANRELRTQLSQGGSADGGVPEEVGEAIMTRWRRLRLMRSLLQDQGEKLQQAGEAIRQRYEVAEQVLAQKDQLAAARAAMATIHEKLNRHQSKAAVGKAAAVMFYLVGVIGGLAGISWAISGEVAPARFAARAVVNADTKGRQTSDEQLAEWQKYVESQIRDARMHEVTAERMARAGIVSLATPGQLSQRIEADLVAESGVSGTLKIELRGTGKAKTIRELDTFVTSLVSQVNATKERRPDGLGVLVAERPNADAGPIDSARLMYAVGFFGVGLVTCLFAGGVAYRKLSTAKIRIEEEQQVDAILDNNNWRQAEEQMRRGR